MGQTLCGSPHLEASSTLATATCPSDGSGPFSLFSPTQISTFAKYAAPTSPYVLSSSRSDGSFTGACGSPGGAAPRYRSRPPLACTAAMYGAHCFFRRPATLSMGGSSAASPTPGKPTASSAIGTIELTSLLPSS
eukprot:CAMPEP_0206245384 /NCGR_PEP_ID=MMETSP0047_2-20121206/18668_1 /ASSEMBLY_ACC=CAM_ASM_000192 /TAXON_ID=195065 /ORGANISM="Chroomonas mesostigmatica_cf, Strain CCMP1168" /LENGTH=134 /DNA_ID=CAMNT_0053670679 /DNA_START=316 /DNA_END=720 /DNA_ORIENTATION=+